MRPMNDHFWMENPWVLVERSHEFFPLEDHTAYEKLNAVSRFFIYAGILVSMYHKNIYWMLYITVPALVFMVYIFFFTTKEPERMSYFETKLGHNPEHTDHQTYKYGMNEGKACVLPTDDNPFMNVQFRDYETRPDRPPACSIEDPMVQKMMRDSFERNIVVNTDDIFDRNNSQRQFYVNPSTTIPNDRATFAQWLYGDAKSCKDNIYDCEPHVPLKQNKMYVYDDYFTNVPN